MVDLVRTRKPDRVRQMSRSPGQAVTPTLSKKADAFPPSPSPILLLVLERGRRPAPFPGVPALLYKGEEKKDTRKEGHVKIPRRKGRYILRGERGGEGNTLSKVFSSLELD